MHEWTRWPEIERSFNFMEGFLRDLWILIEPVSSRSTQEHESRCRPMEYTYNMLSYSLFRAFFFRRWTRTRTRTLGLTSPPCTERYMAYEFLGTETLFWVPDIIKGFSRANYWNKNRIIPWCMKESFFCVGGGAPSEAMETHPWLWSRFLLHRLSRELSGLPILALVDWYVPRDWRPECFYFLAPLACCSWCPHCRNPAGLAILCTYKFGSASMGLEAYRYGTLSQLLLIIQTSALELWLQWIRPRLRLLLQPVMLNGWDWDQRTCPVCLRAHWMTWRLAICRYPGAWSHPGCCRWARRRLVSVGRKLVHRWAPSAVWFTGAAQGGAGDDGGEGQAGGDGGALLSRLRLLGEVRRAEDRSGRLHLDQGTRTHKRHSRVLLSSGAYWPLNLGGMIQHAALWTCV